MKKCYFETTIEYQRECGCKASVDITGFYDDTFPNESYIESIEINGVQPCDEHDFDEAYDLIESEVSSVMNSPDKIRELANK